MKDQLFMRTGVDTESLDVVLSLLKLHDDPDFINMKKEFDDAFKIIQQDAKERGKL